MHVFLVLVTRTKVGPLYLLLNHCIINFKYREVCRKQKNIRLARESIFRFYVISQNRIASCFICSSLNSKASENDVEDAKIESQSLL